MAIICRHSTQFIQVYMEYHSLESHILYLKTNTAELRKAQQFLENLRNLPIATHNWVVVDLSEMDWIPSAAIGTLVATFKELSRKKIQLILVFNHPAMVGTFEQTAMDKVFIIKHELQEAIDYCKQMKQ